VNPLVETRGLTKTFKVGGGLTRTPLMAVEDVSIAVPRGETLGVVGESGSGKSTLGRLLLQLERPSAGDILFDGRSILDAKSAERRRLRKRIQVVFQDPYSSLNPTMSVGKALSEVLSVHEIGTRESRSAQVSDLLERVGLSPSLANRRPRQFSGGQRQRIGIARALAVQPDFIVADEAVSALDVSIQAQVLNLLMRLQDELGLTYLFISHNLSVARHISNTIAVMYLGRIVEQAPTEELFAEPLHPYTQALFRAAPKPVPKRKTITPAVAGDIPNPIDRPSGCHFHPRCPFVMDICRTEYPPAHRRGQRIVACHLYGDGGDTAAGELSSARQ
jgi:peptide/nickel transport system ATP-binding protein/oligopeptide transport system ATP-binding protein